MKYLVIGSGGPGFASPEEAVTVLEEMVLPSFEKLVALEKKKTILAGGLPIGDRSVVFIAEASSNEELDQLLRGLPMWGALDWDVTALQTFAGRADQESDIVKKIRRA